MYVCVRVCVCVQYLLVGQFVFLVWGSGAPLRDVCVPLPHCSTPLCQSSHGVYACVCMCVCVGFKYALKLDKQAEEQKRVTEGQGVSASK